MSTINPNSNKVHFFRHHWSAMRQPPSSMQQNVTFSPNHIARLVLPLVAEEHAAAYFAAFSKHTAAWIELFSKYQCNIRHKHCLQGNSATLNKWLPYITNQSLCGILQDSVSLVANISVAFICKIFDDHLTNRTKGNDYHKHYYISPIILQVLLVTFWFLKFLWTKAPKPSVDIWWAQTFKKALFDSVGDKNLVESFWLLLGELGNWCLLGYKPRPSCRPSTILFSISSYSKRFAIDVIITSPQQSR